MLPLLFTTLLVAAPPEPFQVAQPVIDAGEVRVGPTLVRRFAFVNAGSLPLTVTDLKTECGCTTPTLPQRTYQPGERGELALEVNTLSQPAGPRRWTVQVAYRYGDQTGETTLAVTAKLIREIEVEPAALALTLSANQQIDTDVKITGPMNVLGPITSVRTSSPHLRVGTPFRTSQVEGATAFDFVTVRLLMTDEFPEGRSAEALILTSDSPNYPEIRIPLMIDHKRQQLVSALPARATLVAGGSAVVQLRGADGKPVQVESIEASLPALTTRWAAGPGTFATVRIGLDRTKWHGETLTGEVRLRVAGSAEVVVVPVAVRADD